MLAGENSLENEIENILGKNFLDSSLNGQSQANNEGLGLFYREMLTLLMNEQYSPELLQYNELLIESVRDKVEIQVLVHQRSFLTIK
jgi:hypothetical protein